MSAMARKQRKLEGEGAVTTKTSPGKSLETPVRKKSGGVLLSSEGKNKSRPTFPDLHTGDAIKSEEEEEDEGEGDDDEESDKKVVEINDCECAAVCPSRLKEDMVRCKNSPCEAKMKKSCSGVNPLCYTCCRLESLSRGRKEAEVREESKADIKSLPDEELDLFPEAYRKESSFNALVNGTSTVLNRKPSLGNTTDDTLSSQMSTTSLDEIMSSTPEKTDFRSDSGGSQLSSQGKSIIAKDRDSDDTDLNSGRVLEYRPDLEDYNSHVMFQDRYVKSAPFISVIFSKDTIRTYTLYPINAMHLAFARRPQFWLEVNPVGKPPKHLTLFHNGKFLQVYQYLLGDVRLYKNRFYVARTRLITLRNERSSFALVRPFMTTCANPASGAIVCDLEILEKDPRLFKEAFTIIRFDSAGMNIIFYFSSRLIYVI